MADDDAGGVRGRRLGILIVGLGGNNGVTLLAGLLANKRRLEWEGPTGRMQANLLGCITQLEARGGTGGHQKRYNLAQVADAAVGGWDIRTTPLGQALYESRVLDYDLVRQVRQEMDATEVMAGVWDPDFIGESQHATATHVVPASLTASEKLARLRGDIRSFVAKAGCNGHVTVIWSASVERPTERCYATPSELMAAVDASDPELSPSILYAAAAALEGCSFVNGGSQNTMCPALLQLAEERGCYMLGTDFKAGQTKFKTAAVEYLRHLGLRPLVIASSNHLGNNDMLNLTARKTLDAKMRVKSDIFGGWEESIDHQVRVMYTRLIGDEKRDVVEYTSLGFMGCHHTMLTYTRAMDSALCVPLMLDAAVWCDHFALKRAPQRAVAKALAYLFKVPEGGAEGSDPGFFAQMRALDRLLEACQSQTAASPSPVDVADAAAAAADAAKPLPETTATDGNSALLSGAIVCAGLSCLDMQLEGCGRSHSLETPTAFETMSFCPGGSCPQVCTALARLGVSSVAVCKVGCDAHGDELLRLMLQQQPPAAAAGANSSSSAAGVDCSCVVRDAAVQTSVAVLPIFKGGGRGCFVSLAANDSFSTAELLGALERVASRLQVQPLLPVPAQTAADDGPGSGGGVAAFHFGYPHLMAQMQGQSLATMLQKARAVLGGTPLLSVDLNGVDSGGGEAAKARHAAILGPALPHIDLLHANLEEARAVSGLGDAATARACAEWFLQQGVAVVAVTAGKEGALLATTGDKERIGRGARLARQAMNWRDQVVEARAFATRGEANANGAGDAFVGGLLVALAWHEVLTPLQALQFALLSALSRVDTFLRRSPSPREAGGLMADVLCGKLPGPI